MSTRRYQVGCTALILLMLASCGGGDDDEGAANTGGAATTPVNTGAPAELGVTIIPPDPGTPTGTLAGADTDHDQIQGCWSKIACSPSYAQSNDDFYTNIDRAKAGCLMMGLGARTPGIYLHNTTSSSARGQDSTEHAFLVAGDGSVVHTSARTTSGGQFDLQGTAGVTYTDAERCELAGSSYFDDCKSAVQASANPAFSDPGWVCLFKDPVTVWLTNCQPVEPACG